MTIIAELAFDPTWPWSHAALGLPALAAVAVVLVLLTVWTYLGVKGATFRRVLCVLSLRLAALLITCFLVLRPSYADRDDSIIPSKLILLIDDSKSMNIGDEFQGKSRWENALRVLSAPAVDALLKRLQNEHKIEMAFYRGSDDIRKFDPAGKAEGPRTDVGYWLHALRKSHGGERNLRGLLVFSDGADNGQRFPALQEAAHWRGIPCPVHTFALGSPTTTLKQHDIAIRNLLADPAPVPVKGKLNVKAIIDAPGFENLNANVELYVDDKLVSVKPANLLKTKDNEIHVGEVRPTRAGEMKVTVKVPPQEGEVTTANNEFSTYVTVTSEGLSVLWVEGKFRAWEPRFAIGALAKDPRFSVFYTVRLKDDRAPKVGQEDWFKFKDKHYDVIVIGDISAERFSGRDPDVFRQIHELVKEKGTGLVMLGGYETLSANKSDWHQARPIAELLPVTLRPLGHFDDKIKMTPTDEGQKYLLRLDERDNKRVWLNDFDPLDGMTRLGELKGDATLLATNGGKEPVMAGYQVGAGRTLVFGGDTTWRVWRRTPDAIRAYERFWKQLILWAAKREEAEGNVRIYPDTRRIAAGMGNRLGFKVEMHGKTGLPLKDARYTAKVIGPNKEETEVAVALEGTGGRGYFWKTNLPGEYTIEVTATATDVDGTLLKDKVGSARFLAYPEDPENAQPAANHDFLKKLAIAGGGNFHLAGENELIEFLTNLRNQPTAQGRPKADVWPDWRRTPASDAVADQIAALWLSGMLACFLLFAALLCTEWLLRRRWGMV
jgi:uncharacterized membrane protein